MRFITQAEKQSNTFSKNRLGQAFGNKNNVKLTQEFKHIFRFICPEDYDFNISTNTHFNAFDVNSFVYTTLERGDIFVDVGALGGLYNIIAALKIGPKGNVYAYEPNPLNVEYLKTEHIHKQLIIHCFHLFRLQNLNEA